MGDMGPLAGPQKPPRATAGAPRPSGGHGDVPQPKTARARAAPTAAEARPTSPDCDIPHKKRKTRRGKSKRRNPYTKYGRRSIELIKPEAPYNSNQFLLEDHGDIEEVDENLKHTDQISTTVSAGRTRDSSISVDSDGEFYSSPDDEEQYFVKDFVVDYETMQAERLHSMSKEELIGEYLLLESKIDALSKRLSKDGDSIDVDEDADNIAEDAGDDDVFVQSRLGGFQEQLEALRKENEALRRENETLRTKRAGGGSEDSEDSETDSSDSCSSSSSSSSSSDSRSSCSKTPTSTVDLDHSRTNGHSPAPTSTTTTATTPPPPEVSPSKVPKESV